MYNCTCIYACIKGVYINEEFVFGGCFGEVYSAHTHIDKCRLYRRKHPYCSLCLPVSLFVRLSSIDGFRPVVDRGENGGGRPLSLVPRGSSVSGRSSFSDRPTDRPTSASRSFFSGHFSSARHVLPPPAPVYQQTHRPTYRRTDVIHIRTLPTRTPTPTPKPQPGCKLIKARF